MSDTDKRPDIRLYDEIKDLKKLELHPRFVLVEFLKDTVRKTKAGIYIPTATGADRTLGRYFPILKGPTELQGKVATSVAFHSAANMFQYGDRVFGLFPVDAITAWTTRENIDLDLSF